MENDASVPASSPNGLTKSTVTLIESLTQSESFEPLSKVAEYVERVREIADHWQEQDWNKRERDEELRLNNSRIVSQTWFRGHRDCALSLQPALYRSETWDALKRSSDPINGPNDFEEELFGELFDLEHDQRIDFTSYGHLLNESNQAKSAIDWYFLMQHHGIPTRLLDWSTNALAALFFAVEGYGRAVGNSNNPAPSPGQNRVAVWMIDAYWLAERLNDEWSGPMLPYSEDAAKYVPSLDRLIEGMSDARALVPKPPMPIEPPAMHPRVAAQEGRFIIFGRSRDLLHQKIRTKKNDACKVEELRIKQLQFSESVTSMQYWPSSRNLAFRNERCSPTCKVWQNSCGGSISIESEATTSSQAADECVDVVSPTHSPDIPQYRKRKSASECQPDSNDRRPISAVRNSSG